MNVALEDVQSDAATATCWRALRLLAEQVRSHVGVVRSCSMLIAEEPRVSIGPRPLAPGEGSMVSVVLGAVEADDLGLPSSGETRYRLDELIVLRRLVDGGLPAAVTAMLELYLPYCLAPVHARRMGRAFSVSHFAQSLDGRIATRDGDARWIGCDENRRHAHRMRALCDGILIGARTLRTDRPALTVRHAEGVDPVRIVVGAVDDVACLEEAGPGRIMLIGAGDDGATSSTRVEHVVLPRVNGRIATATILEALYDAGIMSVYIEGGSHTTSAFLAEGNIDVLQLHISPMIIGPGVNSFSPPSVRFVDDAIRLAPHVYRSVGDGMMFVGRVAP